MIPESVLDALRTRVSIVDVVTDLCARVTRPRNGRARAPCIVHGGDNPNSMALDEKQGLAYCHACGWGGDVLALVREVTGASFVEAAGDLAARVGLTLDADPPVGPPARVARQPAAPSQGSDPTSLPPEAVRAFYADLWACVAHLPPTFAMMGWCASRGVTVATAYQLGCRDWGPALPELRCLVARAPRDVTEAAGVLASTRDTDRPELWLPLRGDRWAAGLAVPIWHPEHGAPVGWRWRLYQPFRSGTKVLATYGGGPRLPLGLRLPYHTASSVVGLPYAPASLIVEGEPDWLSVAECAGWRAAAIGLVSASAGWRAEWTRYLDGCEAVIALIHDAHTEKVAGSLARAMRDRYGPEVAGRRYRRATLPEERDANDLHREGLLAGIVAELLGEAAS